MPELENVKKPENAGFVSHRPTSMEERIKRDEEELAELEKQLRGETETPAEEDPKETKGDKEEDSTAQDSDNKDDDKELKGEEKTFKKRYGDLRKHQQKVEKELKDEIATLKEQLENKDKGIALPKSDEDIEKWMKKYPDVAGIVTALVAKETDKRLKSAKLDLDELREGQTQSKLDKARAAIIKKHPDFETLEDSDEFHDWVDEQPKWIADALFEQTDEPAAVIRVLDLYKADTAGITPKKKEEKDAASSVGTKKGRTLPEEDMEKNAWSESKVDKLSDKDYEKYEAEILKAMADKTFVYDMSGGAR